MSDALAHAAEIFQADGYEVEAVLSQSRASRVLKARRRVDGAPVAIKIPRVDLGADAPARDIFLRGAQNARKLEHPNIARVLDFGTTSNGSPFIVMERVEGPSLDEMIRGRKRPPLSQLIDLLLQTCLGLQAAYRRALIHLDVKPSNLLLDLDMKRLKIADFGLARELGKPAPEWMREGADAAGESGISVEGYAVFGTPRYMSPEQALGAGADHRSDIYSLGACFYHLLAGQAPFDGMTEAELVARHRHARLIPIHEINPELPPEICAILMRMLEPDPNDRFPNYEELIEAVDAAKLGQMAREERNKWASTEAGVGEMAGSAPDFSPKRGDVEGNIRASKSRGKSLRARLFLPALFLAALLLILLWLWYNRI